jgi:hemerythrin
MLEDIYERREFLDRTWLFGESISPSVQTRIIGAMSPREFADQGELDKAVKEPSIFIVQQGEFERVAGGEAVETVGGGDFFGCSEILFGAASEYEFNLIKPSSMYEIPVDLLRDIPVVMWKLLETFERRSATT